MRYEQKAELQDSNKERIYEARMYEAKKKARIYAEKKNKNNVLIAKMYNDVDGTKEYKEVKDEQREAININYIGGCNYVWLPMDKTRKKEK